MPEKKDDETIVDTELVTVIPVVIGNWNIDVPLEVAHELDHDDDWDKSEAAAKEIRDLLAEANNGDAPKPAYVRSAINKTLEGLRKHQVKETCTDTIHDFAEVAVYLTDADVWESNRAYYVQLALVDIIKLQPNEVPDSGRLHSVVNMLKMSVDRAKNREAARKAAKK